MKENDYYTWLAQTLYQTAQKQAMSLDVFEFQYGDNEEELISLETVRHGRHATLDFLPDDSIHSVKQLANVFVRAQRYNLTRHKVQLFYCDLQSNTALFHQTVLEQASQNDELFQAFLAHTHHLLGSWDYRNISSVFTQLSERQKIEMSQWQELRFNAKLLCEIFTLYDSVENKKEAIQAYLTRHMSEINETSSVHLPLRDLILSHFSQDLESFRQFYLINDYLDFQNTDPMESVEERYQTTFLKMDLEKALHAYALEGLSINWYHDSIKVLFNACIKTGYANMLNFNLFRNQTEDNHGNPNFDPILDIYIHCSFEHEYEPVFFKQLIKDFFKDFLCKKNSEQIMLLSANLLVDNEIDETVIWLNHRRLHSALHHKNDALKRLKI